MPSSAVNVGSRGTYEELIVDVSRIEPAAPAKFKPPTTAETKAAPTKYEATKAALDAEEDALWPRSAPR